MHASRGGGPLLLSEHGLRPRLPVVDASLVALLLPLSPHHQHQRRSCMPTKSPVPRALRHAAPTQSHRATTASVPLTRWLRGCGGWQGGIRGHRGNEWHRSKEAATDHSTPAKPWHAGRNIFVGSVRARSSSPAEHTRLAIYALWLRLCGCQGQLRTSTTVSGPTPHIRFAALQEPVLFCYIKDLVAHGQAFHKHRALSPRQSHLKMLTASPGEPAGLLCC